VRKTLVAAVVAAVAVVALRGQEKPTGQGF
jgi:hypothetical protein